MRKPAYRQTAALADKGGQNNEYISDYRYLYYCHHRTLQLFILVGRPFLPDVPGMPRQFKLVAHIATNIFLRETQVNICGSAQKSHT